MMLTGLAPSSGRMSCAGNSLRPTCKSYGDNASARLNFSTPLRPRSWSVIPCLPRRISQTHSMMASYRADRAQIVTVNCQPQPVRAAQLSVYPPTPLIQAYFPESRPQSVILTQGLNGDPLRFPLHLFYCPLSLSRGSPINHAVYRITSGAALKPWAGVVLVMKFNGTRRHGYADASTNDLPALSAYFLNYK